MNQPANNTGRTNQDRIEEALDVLETTIQDAAEGTAHPNSERRLICRFFLLGSDDPTSQDLWDAYMDMHAN